jgi:hypothetical protein
MSQFKKNPPSVMVTYRTTVSQISRKQQVAKASNLTMSEINRICEEKGLKSLERQYSINIGPDA